LKRYRDQLCTFIDDIQGAAAVTTATLLAAVNATGLSLQEQTMVIFGFGSAESESRICCSPPCMRLE